jgi:hypothetical protein
MSYYIIPKKSDTISLDNIYFNNNIINDSYVSNCIFNYITSLQEEINNYKISREELNKLEEIINPYNSLLNKELIFLKKVNSIDFFIYIEIIKITNLFDIYEKKSIHIYCVNPNIIESFIFINKYNNIFFKTDNILSIKNKEKVDILCFDVCSNDIKNYIVNFLSILCKILLFQANNGSCIIKINDIYYKPILDIIYIFTCFYEKIYIIKPNSSNVFSNEKYLICKGMRNVDRNNIYKFINNIYLKIIIEKIQITNNNFSLINIDLPYYFINKIEDANLSIGHQKIEHLDILISLINNNLCNEKIDTIIKNNIQKCFLWCEKYKIPYNKINEKNNIFINEIISTV